MQSSTPTHTLLATLGGQPQVVTFTLDLLLQRNIPISNVILIHPASYSALQHSLDGLNAEFFSNRCRATGQPICLHQRVLQHYDIPIDDIVDAPTADRVLDAMDALIYDLKQQNHIIH